MKDPEQFGFVRVAAAVPVVSPANPERNTDAILTLAHSAAEAGARLCVFPELSLTGYTAGDLFLQRRLEEAVAVGAARLAKELPDSLVSVVGAPWRCRGKLFNAALVFAGKRLAGIVPKIYLPNYKEYYEKRWFVSGLGWTGETADWRGAPVPFGTDLLFSIGGPRSPILGVEVCEDLWVPVPPSSFQALAGALLLANLSASDETIGKMDYRRTHLVAAQSARCLAGQVFVSAGPGESSSDLVFGGHILIAENGNVLAEERHFQEGPVLAVTEVDIDRLAADRDRTGSFADAAAAEHRAFRTIEASPPARTAVRALARKVNPEPFVPADPKSLDQRCEEVANIQAAGLARRLRHLAGSRPILGLSGGLDSALAALVSCRALELLGRGPADLACVSMPGPGTSAGTRAAAKKLALALGANFREIDIRDAVVRHLKDIGHAEERDVCFENAQARERTQVLFDLANAEKRIVVGTGDLSEIALGWSTYGGDHLSMYDVNASVPKTLVRHVVGWFARHGPPALSVVLNDVLSTPASPELLPAPADGSVGQRTEDILGPYELHDFFLYHFLRGGDPPARLIYLAEIAFAGRHDTELITTTLRTFVTRFFANQFKRNAMPDGPKVGTVALSPRGDWRMPADVSPEAWLADLPDTKSG